MMASPHPSAPKGDTFEDRRAYPRVEVALPAFLRADGKRLSVQILDLSAGGAKLICAERFATGTAVTLDCGTLRRPAMVRWQTGEALGLCFDSELDARDVAALMERSRALAALMKARE